MHLTYWKLFCICLATTSIIVSAIRLSVYNDILTFPLTIGISIWMIIALHPIKISKSLDDQKIFHIARGIHYLPWFWFFVQLSALVYIVIIIQLIGIDVETILWTLYTLLNLFSTFIFRKTILEIQKLMSMLLISQQLCKTSEINMKLQK